MENRWVEGHTNADPDSEYAPDGKFAPFVVFDMARQANVASGFRWRWLARRWLRRNGQGV